MIVACETCGKVYDDTNRWTYCPHEKFGFPAAEPYPPKKPVAAAATPVEQDVTLGFCIGSSVWPGLSKLIEECGEVLQIAGKLIATGGKEQHYDGSNLRQRLMEELPDLLAAIDFFCQVNKIPGKMLDMRYNEKLAQFRKWHQEQKRGTA